MSFMVRLPIVVINYG